MKLKIATVLWLLGAGSMSIAGSDMREVWLGPQGMGPSKVGAVDFADLFVPEAPWKSAASHVRVFKFYSGYLLNSPQAEVDKMVADLSQRGMEIAVEDGPINLPHNPPSGCGGMGNVEGYGTVARANRISQIIKAAHGRIKYIAMDEPFFYGHYFTKSAARGTDARTPWMNC